MNKAHQQNEIKKSRSKFDYLPWILVLLALIIRLVYLGEIAQNNPNFHNERLVAEVHHLWAKDIIAGQDNTALEPFIRAPLYPYLLAGIYWLFGANTFFPRLIQLIISAALTFGMFKAASNMFGRKAGIAAALIWAFYGPEIFFAGELFETSLTTALIFAVYLCWSRGVNSGKSAWYLFAGALLGLASLMKPNSVLFLPILVGWYLIFRQKRKLPLKNIAFFSVSCLVLISTITIRNALVSGEFVPIAAYGGLNIYIGNNIQSDGVSAILPEGEETEEDLEWGKKHHATALTALSIRKASEAVGYDLSPAQSSRYWWGQTEKQAVENPFHLVTLNLKKNLLFFSGFEYGNTRDIYFSRKFSTVLSILLWNQGLKFPFGMLFPFAGLGMYFAFRKKLEGRGDMVVFLLSAVLSVTLVFVCARFRMSAIPFMVILAGGGIVGAFQELTGKKVIRNTALFIPLLLISNINFFGLKKDIAFQEYYNLGRFYLEQGELQKGYEAMLKSHQSKPDFVPALNELGIIYEKSGYFQQAAEFYRFALKYSGDNPIAHNNLGTALGKAGELDSAIVHLKKALEMDSTYWTAWINLGNAYYFSRNTESAETCYQKALEIQPLNPDVLFNLGNLNLAMGDTAKALEYLLQTEQIEPDYPLLQETIARLTGNGE